MKKVIRDTLFYSIGTSIFLAALGQYFARKDMGFMTEWYEILIFFILYTSFMGFVNYNKYKKKMEKKNQSK